MPDVYIDTDVAAGGTGTSSDPYATWNEAWEAEDTNIDPGETWNFFFKGTAADTPTVIIDGWPTAGAGDVTLNFRPWHTTFGAVDDADDGWYTGDDNYSTSHYRHDSAIGHDSGGIDIRGDDELTDVRMVSIRHLQFRGTFNGGSAHYMISVEYSAQGTIEIFGNRFWFDDSSSTNPRCIRVDASVTGALEMIVTNNVCVYGISNKNMSFCNSNDADTTWKVFNNTVYYGQSGAGEDFCDDVSGNTFHLGNNVAYAFGTADIEMDLVGTVSYQDYNATIVSADRGANGFDCASADFDSAGYGNANRLKPAASQTNAWGTGGVTNGDNSDVPTIDIRGNARNTGTGENTACGAFADSGEGAAAASLVFRQNPMQHLLVR